MGTLSVVRNMSFLKLLSQERMMLPADVQRDQYNVVSQRRPPCKPKHIVYQPNDDPLQKPLYSR